MLYDDSEIKRDGIEVDELSDDEIIEKALNEDNINGLDDEEEETPQGSQPEKKDKEEEPEKKGEASEEEEEEEEGKQPAPKKEEKVEGEDDKLPFHKHPRWQKVMGELKELREFKESTTKSLEVEKKTEKETPPMPQWFTDLYGDNQEGWEAYVAQRQAEREEDRKAILSDIEKRQQEAESKVKEMDAWVDEQVQTLKDDPEIDKFDRNKLLKVMLDYKPTDDDGNLDFYKGYEIYKVLESKQQPSGETPDKNKNKIKKSVAAQTVQKSKSTDNSGVLSSNDVRFKSFSQLAEE